MHDIQKKGSAVTNFLVFFQWNFPSFPFLVVRLIYFLERGWYSANFFFMTMSKFSKNSILSLKSRASFTWLVAAILIWLIMAETKILYRPRIKPSDFRIKEAATVGVHCWSKTPAPESRFSEVAGHTFLTTTSGWLLLE